MRWHVRPRRSSSRDGRASPGGVVASDFAHPMLVTGTPKIVDDPRAAPCAVTRSELPFDDGVVRRRDRGLRGPQPLGASRRGWRELRRVLRPGRRLVVLEFTVPPNPLVRGALPILLPPRPPARGSDRVRPSVGLHVPAELGQGVPGAGRSGGALRAASASEEVGWKLVSGRDRRDPLGTGVAEGLPTGYFPRTRRLSRLALPTARAPSPPRPTSCSNPNGFMTTSDGPEPSEACEQEFVLFPGPRCVRH